VAERLSDYYADVYLRGCGELVKQSTEVDDSDPEIVVITVRAYKPGA
jgi:hypothetical protein